VHFSARLERNIAFYLSVVLTLLYVRETRIFLFFNFGHSQFGMSVYDSRLMLTHLFINHCLGTVGDFMVSIGVYCTKCAQKNSVNTDFEIAHCEYLAIKCVPQLAERLPVKILFSSVPV
jgi:hypothetical protein